MQFKRLRIIDFGPIRDLELHFEPNKVYHFVAENDNGKSMIIDAMEALCKNIANNHVRKFVSDYAEFFIVEGEDFEGNIVKLTRGQGLSEYELRQPGMKTQYFDKCGGGVPEPVQKIVNVYIDSERGEIFNIRKQDDKILFMNTTPGENYSYFQKALGTDALRNSIKSAVQLKNNYVKAIDISYAKIELEKEKLEEYTDLTPDKEEIQVYAEEVKATYNLLQLIKRLDEIYRMLDEEVVEVPDEVLNWDKEKTYNEIMDCIKFSELYSNLGKNLELDEYLKIIDEVCEENKLLEDTYNKHLELNDIIKLMDKRKLLEEYDNLRNSIIDLSISISSEIDSNKQIKEDINKFSLLLDGLDALKDKKLEVQALEQEINERKQELDTFMKKNKFCPVVVQRDDMKCPFSGKGLAELV